MTFAVSHSSNQFPKRSKPGGRASSTGSTRGDAAPSRCGSMPTALPSRAPMRLAAIARGFRTRARRTSDRCLVQLKRFPRLAVRPIELPPGDRPVDGYEPSGPR